MTEEIEARRPTSEDPKEDAIIEAAQKSLMGVLKSLQSRLDPLKTERDLRAAEFEEAERRHRKDEKEYDDTWRQLIGKFLSERARATDAVLENLGLVICYRANHHPLWYREPVDDFYFGLVPPENAQKFERKVWDKGKLTEHEVIWLCKDCAGRQMKDNKRNWCNEYEIETKGQSEIRYSPISKEGKEAANALPVLKPGYPEGLYDYLGLPSPKFLK